MKVILLFIILGYYQTHAGWRDYICCCCGRGDDKRPIDLDINMRVTTSTVKVTKREDKSMVTYKIKPQSGYKVGRFVEGDTVIRTSIEGEGFIYLEVKCSKDTGDVIIVRLKYLEGRNDRGAINFFDFSQGWKMMSTGFYRFLVQKLKNGEIIYREHVVQMYDEYLYKLIHNSRN